MLKQSILLVLCAVVAITILFPSSILACQPHEIAEFKGTTAKCVAQCAPNEAYVSIAPDGAHHCLVRQNAIYTWLLYLIRFLSISVGIAVVGGIVWGGIIYLTARDNTAQTQKSIHIIGNAIVGLLLYLLMFAILNFLIPGGILV